MPGKKSTQVWTVLLFTLTMAGIASPLWSNESPEPGLWRVTIKTDFDGGSDRSPRKVLEYCVKRMQSIPQITLPDESCEIQQIKLGFQSLSWTTHCPRSSGETTGNGKIQFQGREFEGNAKYFTRIRGSNSNFPMRHFISGVRIGSC